MSRIKEAAATENVSWRALVEATRRTGNLRAAVGNSLMTSPGERTRTDRALIGMARDITAETAAKDDKPRRRQVGVNQLSGKVNGRWVQNGQPRGRRGRQG